MAIERLSFPEYLDVPEGIPFNPREFQTVPFALLEEHRGKVSVLPEGDYDLTPKIWVSFIHFHKLIVGAEGDAWYRQLPVGANIGISRIEVTETTSKYLGIEPGGTQIHLPTSGNLVVVAYNHEGQSRLYEIIYHIPGRSPLVEVPLSEFRAA